MSPESKRRIAMARLRERARRISLIRRSVVAGAVATFALAWGLALSDQLAHGTKTSPDDGSSQSQGGDDGPVVVTADQETETDEGFVPVSPAPTTVAPVTPSPAPLTTSQS